MRNVKSIFAIGIWLLFPVCSALAQVNIINTVVGGGSQNNIPGLQAEIGYSPSVAVDQNGNIYIASPPLDQVFKLGSSGLSVVAGTGAPGYSGDSGLATSATLSGPEGVAVDSSGNLFIADSGNFRIRRVDAGTHVITTVAGNGTPCYPSGPCGDGAAATSAQISPQAVAVDSKGNVLIADVGADRIRSVAAGTQIITSVAGNGTPCTNPTTPCGDGKAANQAELYKPSGIAVDSLGDVFIADTGDYRIRRVDASTQNISTVAGNGTNGFNGDGILATSAELDSPYGVVVDGTGNLYIGDTLNNRIRFVNKGTQIITTVAGTGTSGFKGDSGPATSAELYNPEGVALDSTGDLIIADYYNYRIRSVNQGTKNIATIAGGGSGGDNGPADAATLVSPEGIALDTAADLFISDISNAGRIRQVDANSQHDITTVAPVGALSVAVDGSGNLFIAYGPGNVIYRVAKGSDTPVIFAGTGKAAFGGDGGPATSAYLYYPDGVALDGAGNLFIADTENNRIRRVDTAGTITTVAGTGTQGFSGDGGPATNAEFSNPWAVALDSSGNLFIGDFGNNCIRRVDASTQIITTVAGNGTQGFSGDGGPATGAELNLVAGVAVALDSFSNLFISDSENHRIRRVDAVSGIINTVAGNGTDGFSGDGGPALSANLSYPDGVAVDGSGNLIIADSTNNRVRETLLPPFVVLQPGSLTFSNQNLGTTSPAQPVQLSNTGLAPLTISSIAMSTGFAETDNCAGSVAAKSSCTLNVTFTPTGSGVQTGTITVTDDSFGSPHDVSLTGTGTATTVSLSPAPTFPSEPVGTTSPSQAVTVTNAGNANLAFTAIGVTAPFAIATSGTTCLISSSVIPTGTCTVAITFTPTAGGTASGNLSFTDNATGSPQTLSLTAIGIGTGTTVSLSAAPSFPSEPIGTTSTAQTVTVTNTGNAALNFTAIGVTGPFAIATAANPCSTSGSVVPLGACTVAITFTPTAAGTASGTLSLAMNTTPSTQTVSLSGTGQDFTLGTPSGSSSSQTVAPGQTATYTLSVGGVSGLSQTVSFACTGAPSEATCTVSPSPAAPGSNVTVTVTTMAPSAIAPRTLPPVLPRLPRPQTLLMLALLLAGLAWAVRGWRQFGGTRLRAALLTLAAGLLLILAMVACGGGGGGGGGGSSNPGTPAGTYPLTVTGTVGSGSTALSHKVALTLTVS